METRILNREEMLFALDHLYKELGAKAKNACIELVYREDGKAIKLYCDDFKTTGNASTTTSEMVRS